MAIKTDTFTGGGGGGGGAVDSVNGATGVVVLSADDLAADHTASNYTAANANIDGHLSGIDTKLGTFAAGLTYKGTFDASAGTPSLTNALQGDLYIIDTAGTIYGQTWAVGDHLLVNADMGGTITNSKLDKVDNTDQVTSVNTQTGTVVLSGDDLAADHTAVNYTAANANIDGHLSGIDSKLASQLESGDNISLLNNNSGFISDITGESLNDLSDVSFTAGAGIDNYVLKYDNGTSSWGAEAESTAAAASETVAGVIEIATNAEASAGTATDKALVPSNVSSLDLSAMDNTTSAFISDITSESLNDLSDVSFTAGAGIDNYVLTYDNGTSSWGAEAAPTAAAASETVAGVIEIATNAEATAATATDKALVPSNISSLDLSAMDNTSSAFISGITSESLNDLSDVSFTAGAGIDNYVLTYDNATSSWGAEASAGGGGGGYTYSAITADPANAQAGYHYSCTGTFTITLPTTGVSSGEEIRIKNMGTGTITIDPQTSNIDDSTTDYVLDVQYSAITLVSTGTHWEII
jgi:6,7-dimethyl-8-ribityllumazine synthase